MYNQIPAMLPQGGHMLEIGSAPGHNLLRLAALAGAEPFGIEYSPSGVTVQRELFLRAGLDPQHVIYADFFSDDLLLSLKASFDVVASFGFIEHFDDTELVVRRHLEFLRPGGCIVVSVPNLNGLNAAIARAFDKELLLIHNRRAMTPAALERVLRMGGVDVTFCKYIGTLDLALCTGGRNINVNVKVLLLKWQRLVNLLTSVIPIDVRIEHPAVSPHILAIGFLPSRRDAVGQSS
ncbi:MAG: class I SAM-dependent methyltransferase [Chloroflexi bacterium]|nr:class I SAM-dependent methyltransferase [Chloroflexota bacterium]